MVCVLLVWIVFVAMDLSAAEDRWTTCKLSACLSNWLLALSSALLMCTVMHGNSTSDMQHFVHADENTLTGTSWQTSFQGILFMQRFERK
jgi:hypothetical protein